ncbi:Asp-tRNA(Asn)/Glu-tRNA(Gln) amidotransferase subunit GatA, partial [Candidatus Shapirobacteria bacterium CG07_land_8_20_14_0_80_39_12]
KAKEIDKILGYKDTKILSDYPLLGVTVAYKDLFLTKGIRTTAGSNVLKDYIPTYSATVVNKLKKAGAIMLGKVNCDAWAQGSSGENSDFGPTQNPWKKGYVPGGTSSGSAASVAGNLSQIASGTDTGGSIRQPANFCGVVGIKPTYGAVSRYGVVAAVSSFDSIGCLTRTSYDSQAVFDVIKGSDGFDSNVRDFNYLKPKNKLTIGIPKEYFISGLDKEIEKSLQQSVNSLEKMGMKMKEISLKTTKYAVPAYYIINTAEYSSNLGRYDGIRYGESRKEFGQEARRRIMLGSYVLSAGYYDAFYLKAQKVRSRIINEFNQAFEEVDVMIAPVSPFLPFKIGEKINDPLKMYLADVFTVAPSMAGIPGLSIPSGFSKSGLPMGFQLMGPRFSEYSLFSLGEMFEKATDYKPNVAKL